MTERGVVTSLKLAVRKVLALVEVPKGLPLREVAMKEELPVNTKPPASAAKIREVIEASVLTVILPVTSPFFPVAMLRIKKRLSVLPEKVMSKLDPTCTKKSSLLGDAAVPPMVRRLGLLPVVGPDKITLTLLMNRSRPIVWRDSLPPKSTTIGSGPLVLEGKRAPMLPSKIRISDGLGVRPLTALVGEVLQFAPSFQSFTLLVF